MATFPLLSSGAVCQYPVKVVYQQGVEVLRYLDGSDQRFLRQGRQFRQWEIRLDLLSDDELASLEQFFEGRLGDYSSFDFMDPFTRRVVSNCYIGDPHLTGERGAGGKNSTSLWVVEANV